MLRAIDYPYQYELDVVFRDLDAMGHVNNAVYFTYLETARLRYLMDLLALPEIGAIPVIMASTLWGATGDWGRHQPVRDKEF